MVVYAGNDKSGMSTRHSVAVWVSLCVRESANEADLRTKTAHARHTTFSECGINGMGFQVSFMNHVLVSSNLGLQYTAEEKLRQTHLRLLALC